MTPSARAGRRWRNGARRSTAPAPTRGSPASPDRRPSGRDTSAEAAATPATGRGRGGCRASCARALARRVGPLRGPTISTAWSARFASRLSGGRLGNSDEAQELVRRRQLREQLPRAVLAELLHGIA